MTSNLSKSIRENASSVALAVEPPLSNIARVKTLKGYEVNIPQHQVPSVSPDGIVNNLWTFSSNGDYTNALQNGGIQNIQIALGQGSGKTNGKVWIRMNITNSSSTTAVQMVPAPFWFNNINLQTPGGDIIQNFDPWAQWFSTISTIDHEKWHMLYPLINSSDQYKTGPPLAPLASLDVWVPLMGNVYSAGNIPTKELDGDSICYLTFAPPSSTILSGPTNALVINSLALVFDMQSLDSSLVSTLSNEYGQFDHSFIYPFQRIMNFTQTFNVGAQYQYQLTGFTGDISFLMFVLRASNVGTDLYRGQVIQDFQIQNQEGVTITSAMFVPGTYNKNGQLSKWFLGDWMKQHNYYGWSFSSKDSGPVEFLVAGRKQGAYGFCGREQLVIDTSSVAAVNEEINFATSQAGDFATGSFASFEWTDFDGRIWTSAAIDLSTATAATLASTIQAIPNFFGTVTCSTPAGGAFNVTFTGWYAATPICSTGAGLQLRGVIQTTGGSTHGIESMVRTVTTPGVAGIINGNTYTLTILGFTSSILSISSNAGGKTKGRQRIQNA